MGDGRMIVLVSGSVDTRVRAPVGQGVTSTQVIDSKRRTGGNVEV